eukprot:1163094-Rhodomonas_salina.3
MPCVSPTNRPSGAPGTDSSLRTCACVEKRLSSAIGPRHRNAIMLYRRAASSLAENGSVTLPSFTSFGKYPTWNSLQLSAETEHTERMGAYRYYIPPIRPASCPDVLDIASRSPDGSHVPGQNARSRLPVRVPHAVFLVDFLSAEAVPIQVELAVLDALPGLGIAYTSGQSIAKASQSEGVGRWGGRDLSMVAEVTTTRCLVIPGIREIPRLDDHVPGNGIANVRSGQRWRSARAELVSVAEFAQREKPTSLADIA